MEEPAPAAMRRTDWTLAYFLAAGVALAALAAMATAPVSDLLGDSRYAVPSTLHGISAMLYVIIATVVAYLGYLLYVGRLRAYRDLRILAGLSALFSLVTVMFGNWIYIYYRAPAGPRSYFLENQATLHEIFFEFKEFVALFTLPLTVAASFILWRERESLQENPRLRQAVGAMLILGWLYLMLTFGLGAAITKLRSV